MSKVNYYAEFYQTCLHYNFGIVINKEGKVDALVREKEPLVFFSKSCFGTRRCYEDLLDFIAEYYRKYNIELDDDLAGRFLIL